MGAAIFFWRHAKDIRPFNGPILSLENVLDQLVEQGIGVTKLLVLNALVVFRMKKLFQLPANCEDQAISLIFQPQFTYLLF